MSETVTRLRPQTRIDDNGDEVIDNSAPPAQLAIADCRVAPRTEQELLDLGRQGSESGWAIYAPPGTTVLPSDKIDVRGITYDVDGSPEVWGKGTVFRTIRVEG